MAQNSADFAINLDDGTAGPAADAARALETLRARIDADTKALREMERAMKNLQRGSSVNIEQFRELQSKIEAKRQSIASAQSEFLSLGGSFGTTGKRARAASAEFSLFGEASKRLPGPLRSIGEGLTKLQEASGAARLVLLKVAMVAFTAAVVAGTVALTRYGIAASEAYRAEALQLEGLARTRDWFGRAADSGQFLQATIDKVGASSALGRSQLIQYTDQLYRMGLRAGALETALEGVAITAAAQGERGAQQFIALAAGASRFQGGLRRLTDDAKARLGDLADKQLLSLSVQMRKLRENVSTLFAGLKVEGFLRSLKQITDLFSTTTANGRALRTILTTALQPFVNSFEATAPIAKRFFQGITIGALLITIGFLRIRNAFRSAFGDSALRNLDMANVALGLGVVVVGALAGTMAVLAVKAAILAAPFVATAAALGALLYGAYRVTNFLLNFDWNRPANEIVNGLVDGIKGAASRFFEAMKNLASGGAKVFKNFFGIASPARLTRGYAIDIGRGSELGLLDSIPRVNRASERLAEAANPVRSRAEEPELAGVPVARVPAPEPTETPERRAPNGGARVSGGSSVVVTFSEGAIQIQTDSANATDLAEQLREPLTSLLQGVLTTLGGQPA